MNEHDHPSSQAKPEGPLEQPPGGSPADPSKPRKKPGPKKGYKRKTTAKAAPDEKSMTPQEAVSAFLELSEKLSPEVHDRLREVGVVVPRGNIKDALQGKYRLGYRCPWCNGVPIYFVGEGDNWIEAELADGEIELMPPSSVPIEQLAWIQPGQDPRTVNRQHPSCKCGAGVDLGPGRTLKRRRIVNISRFTESRDLSYDHVKAKKNLRRKELEDMKASDGSIPAPQMSTSYDDPRDLHASDFLSPQQKAEISQVAEAHDLAGMLSKVSGKPR